MWPYLWFDFWVGLTVEMTTLGAIRATQAAFRAAMPEVKS